MRYVALYVLAVQVNFVVVAKPDYSVNAVEIVYPLVVTLLRYKVIAVVDILAVYCTDRRNSVLACAYSVYVVGIVNAILLIGVAK